MPCFDGSRVVAERDGCDAWARTHEALMPAVAEVLGDAGVGPGAVERVVCGAGPGSFTSLRIAGGDREGDRARGGVPAVPVPRSRWSSASREPFAPGRYLAAIDALRGE